MFCWLRGGSYPLSGNTGWCAGARRPKKLEEVTLDSFYPDRRWAKLTRSWFPGDQKTHMELTIYMFPKNAQLVLALVDTWAESVIIYSKTNHFTGLIACKEGYGGHYIIVWKAQVSLGMEHLSQCLYDVYVSPIGEYTLWVDILNGVQLDTMQREF